MKFEGRLAKNEPRSNFVYIAVSAAFIAILVAWATTASDPFPPVPSGEENARFAIDVTVGLSSVVVNASLILLTILAAFVGYMLSEKQPTEGFRICSVITGFLMMASIWAAGIGMTKARNAVWSGSFDLESARECFGLQALLAVLGIFFFSIVLIVYGGISRQWNGMPSGAGSAALGPRGDSSQLSAGLHALADLIDRQDRRTGDMAGEIEKLNARLQQLESKPRTGEGT